MAMVVLDSLALAADPARLGSADGGK